MGVWGVLQLLLVNYMQVSFIVYVIVTVVYWGACACKRACKCAFLCGMCSSAHSCGCVVNDRDDMAVF